MNILKDKNRMILGFEAVLFAGVFGIAFHSWMVFIALTAGLLAILLQKKGIMYGMVVLSGLWGFIGFSIGYGISLNWACELGGGFFLMGIGAHLRGLKRPVISTIASVIKNELEWRRNSFGYRPNLN